MGCRIDGRQSSVRHAVSEFSKKGLGADYYGYHNIDHELEAAYFTLLANGQYQQENKFIQDDIKYLFVAHFFMIMIP